MNNQSPKEQLIFGTPAKQFFFGKPYTPDMAKRKIENAAIIAGLFGIFALFLSPMEPLRLLDAALFFCVAFFLKRKKSRIAAIAMLILSVIGLVNAALKGGGGISPLIGLVFAFMATKATFILNDRARKASNAKHR